VVKLVDWLVSWSLVLSVKVQVLGPIFKILVKITLRHS